MTIYICDDEENIRNDVERRVQTILPDDTIMTFGSGKELLNASLQAPDIAILDVDMPGMNGIETAATLKARDNDTIIIFLTGYDRYMPDAFDVHAFGYILKPIDDSRFHRVILEAATYIQSKIRDDQKSILIKSGTFQRKLPLRDIICIESFNKKVIIHLEHERIETYARMEDIEHELGSDFYRCHRCYIINMARVSGYDSSSVTLSDGETIPIAQKKFSLFVKSFLHFARHGGIRPI